MSTEHPIIFTGWSVPRILNRQKTQTRRVIKPQPNKEIQDWALDAGSWRREDGTWRFYDDLENHFPWYPARRCPYGVPGDLLWVRETHYRFGHWNKNGISKTGRQKWRFKATTTEPHFADDPPDDVKPYAYRAEAWYKRPSIFLPKKYARIWLRAKSVRVERVQEIGMRGCIAEGVDASVEGHVLSAPQLRGRFRALWDSINAKRGYGWGVNPGVWATEFELLKGGKP